MFCLGKHTVVLPFVKLQSRNRAATSVSHKRCTSSCQRVITASLSMNEARVGSRARCWYIGPTRDPSKTISSTTNFLKYSQINGVAILRDSTFGNWYQVWVWLRDELGTGFGVVVQGTGRTTGGVGFPGFVSKRLKNVLGVWTWVHVWIRIHGQAHCLPPPYKSGNYLKYEGNRSVFVYSRFQHSRFRHTVNWQNETSRRILR